MKWTPASENEVLRDWPSARSIKNEQGDVISTRDQEWTVISVLVSNPKTCKYLGRISWDSNFYSDKDANEDADFIDVYQVLGVGYVAFEFICAGYSSYTFEPEETLSVITTGDMKVFANHILDREQREVFLEAMK